MVHSNKHCGALGANVFAGRPAARPAGSWALALGLDVSRG
jgi:hypothetical protein